MRDAVRPSAETRPSVVQTFIMDNRSDSVFIPDLDLIVIGVAKLRQASAPAAEAWELKDSRALAEERAAGGSESENGIVFKRCLTE